MSELTLDRLTYFPDPFVEWYRERRFQLAFALSLIAHALLIAFVPGMHAVSIEAPATITVELVSPISDVPTKVRKLAKEVPAKLESPPALPSVEPQVLPPSVVERDPVLREPVRPAQTKIFPRPEPIPEKVIERPDLLQLDPPRILSDPRPSPRADLARIEPKIERQPVLKEEPRLASQSDVRPEPMPMPRTNIQPERRVEPQRSTTPPVVDAPVVRRETPLPAAPTSTVNVAAPVSVPRLPQEVSDSRPTPVASVTAPTTAPPVTAPAPPRSIAQPTAFKESPDAAIKMREESMLVSYVQNVKRRVDEQKRYPWRAREAGWEGTTKVRVRLAPDGSVVDVVVEEKSEHSVLDDAALKMVKSLKPFPPLPDALRGKEHTIIVPIQFRIARS